MRRSPISSPMECATSASTAATRWSKPHVVADERRSSPISTSSFRLSPLRSRRAFAIYYTHDRRSFFTHVADYTRKKLVFDVNPRQYELNDVLEDLRTTGWKSVTLRPFFSPQRVALPNPLLKGLRALEDVGPLARALLRFRFTYVCAAAR
jgi:hypothetical protein